MSFDSISGLLPLARRCNGAFSVRTRVASDTKIVHERNFGALGREEWILLKGRIKQERMPMGILLVLSDGYFERLFSGLDYVIAYGEVQIKILSCGCDFELSYFYTDKTKNL